MYVIGQQNAGHCLLSLALCYLSNLVQKPSDPLEQAHTPPATGNAGVKNFHPPTTTPIVTPTTDPDPLLKARKLMLTALQQLQEIYNTPAKGNSE
jgi:hypothetical protein